ncbi:hypothetical protein FA15DRAFT_294808 [Coprinopsis marcescibilis]|uniref:NYN domain-containing protein n=1 Tax=Coprinopsis marcescibilis TaxID=230819 RepID=A0A5C3L0G0_COPMA|nr:hypothetical protein FA15DRAFT_294808 [Coprinopsis marcescibilis]
MNCNPPTSTSGYDLVQSIKTVAKQFGSVKLFKAYLEVPANANSSTSSRSSKLRSELQVSGVSLTDCPHNNRKDAADKMMLVDMLAHAIDHSPPTTTFMIISGDRDFAYALSILTLRLYQVVLVTLPNAHISLTKQATVCFDWFSDVINVIRPRDVTISLNSPFTTSPSKRKRPPPKNDHTGTGLQLCSIRFRNEEGSPSAQDVFFQVVDTPPEGIYPPAHGYLVETPALDEDHDDFGTSSDSLDDAGSYDSALYDTSSEFGYESDREEPEVLTYMSDLEEDNEQQSGIKDAASYERKGDACLNDNYVSEPFQPLVKQLKWYHDRGYDRVLRSELGFDLTTSRCDYQAAGVTKFKRYVVLAERMGYVELGGVGGDAWVRLRL